MTHSCCGVFFFLNRFGSEFGSGGGRPFSPSHIWRSSATSITDIEEAAVILHLDVLGLSPFMMIATLPSRRRVVGLSIGALESPFSSGFPRGYRVSSRPGFLYTSRGRCSPRFGQNETPSLLHIFPFGTGLQNNSIEHRSKS